VGPIRRARRDGGPKSRPAAQASGSSAVIVCESVVGNSIRPKWQVRHEIAQRWAKDDDELDAFPDL